MIKAITDLMNGLNIDINFLSIKRKIVDTNNYTSYNIKAEARIGSNVISNFQFDTFPLDNNKIILLYCPDDGSELFADLVEAKIDEIKQLTFSQGATESDFLLNAYLEMELDNYKALTVKVL